MRTGRRGSELAFLVMGILAVTALRCGTPAGAADPMDDAARVAIELGRTTGRVADAQDDLRRAEAQVVTTQASLNVTLGKQAVNRAELETVLERLRERSVLAYQKSGASAVAPLDVQRVSDLDTAQRYATIAGRIDTRERDALQQTADQLEAERADRQADHDRWVAQRDDVRQRVEQLIEEQAHERESLDQVGAVPVMGDATLRATQLAAWFRSTGAVPQLAPGTTIDDIAAIYVDEGRAEHVRGDLAFAQAIVETGSFAVAAGNNYSGIGVCDSCIGGAAFPTPRDGVRAQIQLLRNYADPDSTAERLAHPPSPSLYGADVEKAARLYDSFFLKGKAPLWNLMGHGNWATDPHYAGKVVAVFNQMVAFANAHPEIP